MLLRVFPIPNNVFLQGLWREVVGYSVWCPAAPLHLLKTVEQVERCNMNDFYILAYNQKILHYSFSDKLHPQWVS